MGLILGLNNNNSTGLGESGMSFAPGLRDIAFDDALGPAGLLTDAYSVRGDNLLTSDNILTDVNTVGLYARNNGDSDLSMQNYLELSLQDIPFGDDVSSAEAYKLDFDIDTDGDGVYDFNLTEIITADQMRVGYDTQSWTQEIKSGFTGSDPDFPGEYGRGTIEAIPEPSALALILLAGTGMLVAKRKLSNIGRRK